MAVTFSFAYGTRWHIMLPLQVHEDESESESEIVYSIDMHRIHLQIKLHNIITQTHM